MPDQTATATSGIARKFSLGARVLNRRDPRDAWMVEGYSSLGARMLRLYCGTMSMISPEEEWIEMPDDWVDPPHISVWVHRRRNQRRGAPGQGRARCGRSVLSARVSALRGGSVPLARAAPRPAAGPAGRGGAAMSELLDVIEVEIAATAPRARYWRSTMTKLDAVGAICNGRNTARRPEMSLFSRGPDRPALNSGVTLAHQSPVR